MKHQDGAVPLPPIVAQRSAVIADGHEPPAAQDLTVPAADLPSSEAFWRQRLQAFRLLSLPFRLRAAAAEPEWQASPWQEVASLTPASPDERLISMLSVYAVYLIRLTGETTFQLGWAVRPQEPFELLAPVVPMEVFADLERPFREVQDYFAAEHALLAQHQGCARDLMEQCSVPSAGGLPWALGISLVDQRAGTTSSANAPLQDSVSGELLTLQLDFQAVAAFRWLYDAARLDADQIARMSQHILELAASTGVAASAAAAFAPAGRLNLLPAAERELLLETWNRTGMEFPENLCVHQLFEQQVERAPQAHAVVFEQETLTYSGLNEQANRLAHRLVELGVGPDQRVAVCLERSPALAVSLLAVLKAGGAYVPMDTAYPAERLAYILGDSQPAVLLADQAGRQALGDSAPPALPVLDPNLPLTGPEHNPQRTDLAPNHLVYIIYTSGSTGTPKGVMVEHRHLNNLIHWHLRDFSVRAGTRSTATAGLAFDASAWELWPALSSGGTLLLPPRAVARDIAQMLEWWARQPLDISFLVTPLAAMVLREQAIGRTLRCLLIGGDHLDRMPSVLPENLSLINNYGPTETTIVATSGRLHPGEPTIHIGRPIANTRLYVLDTYGQPVPLGAVGELYIGGAGVARGYLNRPELTAERFLEDPYCGVSGQRMYRSGDLVRYLPDGKLEFLGRNDYQVKIRGFRIELGEIEARLLEHPAIREAVVLAQEETPGEKRLVAYVTSQQEAPELAATLRAHVGAALPEYMVPAAFVLLEKFPLTPNGKLDRKALPAPPAEAYAREAYEPPQGSMETALAAIWTELLQVERVSRNDHFFALGGHSLLAVRMMSRIAALGVDVPLSTLFAAPTLRVFGEAVDERLRLGAVALPDIRSAPRDRALPLSFAQQRLWFLAQLEQRSDNYHIPLAFRLRGAVDVAALGAALNHLWTRHEALRTVFVLEEGRPVVRLLAPQLGLPFPQDDLRGSADAPAQLDRLSRQEAYAPFDLERGPLIRARLIRLADAEYIFLLTQHHIVADGWSMGILVHELSALYSGRALPALEVQYPDFAVWQRQWLAGERLETQSAYWRSVLADAPAFLALPTDRPRPPKQTFAGAHLPVRLDAEVTGKLKRLSQQHGGTLFMTMMGAWAAVLSRVSGQQELVVGTATANRRHRQIEGLIGFFVNALALRIDLSQEPTAAQLLAQVRQRVLGAQEHQDLPFEQVVEIVHPPRSMDHTPVFQVMFVWQNNELGEWRLPGVEVETVQVGYDIVRFDVELSLSEVGDEIAGTLSYATALFDRQTMERHLGYLRAMLEALAADLAQSVTEIDLFSASERKLLLETWNATEAAYPEHACIQQLFEQQVERTPEAIALIFDQETLSYAELNRKSNRLAHYLRELGVAPDQRVAICVERSAAMVVGILAILKAGGAYVPLDPGYPAERLAYMLRDSAPVALLMDSRTQARLAPIPGGGTAMPLLLLDTPEPAWQTHPEHNLDAHGLTPAHLAYVIYTSGSTGIPKGVLVEHRNVVRLVCNTDYVQLAPHDVIAQASNVSFDAATFEIWGALLNGCRLTGISRFDLLTPGEHFKSLNVSVLFLTTALFQECVRTDPRVFEGIGQLFFGGEACDPAIVHRARQAFGPRKLVHVYGPTETTTFASFFPVAAEEEPTVPIGRPIANTRLYILDEHRQPVPLGAPGELYVGGTGVARGYLNQPDLTAERFVRDPFCSVPGSRMYRTGDLARFLADGNVEFLGRNDDQVKIRGFRIELGEIEARLREHAAVREAVVMVRQDAPGEKRLVAYITTTPIANSSELAGVLRTYLGARLPDYMMPSAFVRLESFPLTPNGKLDRKALPAPDEEAFARQAYEPPQGELETIVALLWAELLKMDRVSRHDHFFDLGGHSLLAVQIVERLRRVGMGVPVRVLFDNPTVHELAASLGKQWEVAVPANRITPETRALTPDLLPLIDLTQEDIDRIVDRVSGGVSNIQDIYALSPLQDGILFHHLLATEGDPYLLITQTAFAERSLLDRYLAAVQQVANRHDILRTGFVWENLSAPAQVIWRHAALSVTEIEFDASAGPAAEQLLRRFDPRHYRLDISEPPLLRFAVTRAENGRWLLLTLLHHLIGDHSTLEVLQTEIQAFLDGRGQTLGPPQPFRNLVAQARLGGSPQEHERFFREMLGMVEEPTLAFGLAEVHRDGSEVSEFHRMLPVQLNVRLRRQAKRVGVSLAAVCHLAWAQVLGRAAAQDSVVFATVLFGRMQGGEGADRAMGLFINTLPLRVELNLAAPQAVRAAQATLAGLLAHEHAPLALAQRCSSVPSGAPLFNALLNYRHNVLSLEDAAAQAGVEFLGARESSNYPLGLSVEDSGDALGLTAQTIRPLSSERICGYMQQALESLADALEQNAETPVRRLEVLPAAERELLLETWNATQAEFPGHLCIHQLFEQQVERAPYATALVFQQQALTYAELNQRANQLAHRLMEFGVGPDQRVALCVERSPAIVIAFLAILKAGAAYVPLDPVYPGERLSYILTDAQPTLLLADPAGRAALGEAALAAQPVLDPNHLSPGPDHNPQRAELTSRDLAYIIYTSGSTGQPKGVMLEHRGAINMALAQVERFALNPSSRAIQFASISFDASISEFLMTLAAGAALHLPAERERRGTELLQYLEREGITHATLPPALLDLADVPGLSSLQMLVLAGESPSAALVAACKDQTNVTNAYGPTETTVCATTWLCPRDFAGVVVPIGRPIANTRLYLLDRFGQPVPLGAAGELYIGGVGVARGFLNRPELTAERFLDDPFSEGRMYRTGDLARYLPNADLEFLGRNDHQVKIRGFRVELGEIEARLLEHPSVREALVIAHGDRSSDKRLVAYLTTAPEAQITDLAGMLRAHLGGRLPDYMAPSAFVRLDEFPLTPNGKIDRRALPAPDAEAYARETYEPPQGEIETRLASIWADLLKVERIGRNDHFFALGGHSLLAVRMMSRVAALGVELPLSVLFASPTLHGFAEAVTRRRDQGSVERPGITPAPRTEALPLSFAQQRLWFLAQLEQRTDNYHIPLALRLRGALDVAPWKQALNSLWSRHEALRSVFVSKDGQPEVHLLSSALGLPLVEHDLRSLPETAVQLERLAREEARATFDLARGPLIRARLIRLAEEEYVFLLTQHHIVSDGWSLGILVHELSQLYSGDSLPELPIQYPDYAAWQRRWLAGERLQTQSAYWRKALADAPALLSLPTDRPRPARQSLTGAFVLVRINAPLAEQLRQVSQQCGVTLYMTVLAAWAAVLSRLSGQHDIVIGTPTANRGHREIESLIGFFVNTLALRIDVDGDPSASGLLSRVKQTVLSAQEHQDLPLEQVVEIVQPPRRMDHTPLFQVMFVWQNNELGEWRLPGVEVQPVETDYVTANFDLDLTLAEQGSEITGALTYATALFDEPTIARHVGYLHAMLEAMAADPQQSVTTIDLLSPSERKLLLETWNATRDYPERVCIHQLFEEQVKQTPDAVALVFEEEALTYAELNQRANRLAHQLIKLGVKPEARVAICVERSWATVVGILAILKAGGGYVPLDPAYPRERLAYILGDAEPTLLLADEACRQALGEAALAGLPVLDPNLASAGPTRNPRPAGLTPRDLAYIIYTSGSTGVPKGVIIEHRQIVRLLDATQPWFAFNAQDAWSLFHSYAFDFSVWELWGALAYGGRLVIVPHSVARSAPDFLQFLHRHGITVLNQTPSSFRALIGAQRESEQRLTALRYVIFGGEALEPSMLKPWYERYAEDHPQLINMYGITETTVHVTYRPLTAADCDGAGSPIGERIPDLKLYLLDSHAQPVPLGAQGELYVGGAGVARGYLNRLELTAERFLTDPFSAVPGARMYRAGDLGRYLPDGSMDFLGRNDHQVKIRGFRIELGEIEAGLLEHVWIREAVVIAREDIPGEKRLVAYVTTAPEGETEELAAALRAHLAVRLPEYMVPAAFVRLQGLPLTHNGKLDRTALPAPDTQAYVRHAYEPPQGEVETIVASIWADLLKVERVSRHDHFFELGGHSLLAVQMVERLRRLGLGVPVRVLFDNPTVRELAASVGKQREVAVPVKRITPETRALTPDLLPLIDLTQEDLDHIVELVPGGVSNIQDIYALSPLQDGILFHHLLATEGDPYLLITQTVFAERSLLDRYLAAVQQVVNRHDILRTGFVWESLSAPGQVVWRHAALSVTEVEIDPSQGSGAEQLLRRFDPRHYRVDLKQPPLLRFAVAREEDGRWRLLTLLHHLIGDHSTLELLHTEIQAFLDGREDTLTPPQPFRNLIAQARMGVSPQEHERFFREMLGEVEEPTLPFGVSEVHRDGRAVTELHRMLSPELNHRLRAQARRLGVSLASVCHVAWAQVLGRATGQQAVVFGTVLFGRMYGGEGADRAMGLFINTLPLRLDLAGPARVVVRNTQARLAGLLAHEHATLALAQRCSSVPAGVPLFNSLLNYRHNVLSVEDASRPGMEFQGAQERTNYPFALSVEDFGEALGLTAQVAQPLLPETICGYMQRALESLVEALEQDAETPVRQLEVLPAAERQLLLKTWNATQAPYPEHLCIHELFEQQVERTPAAIALVFEEQTFTYAELNQRANRLAHQLIELGVGPDERVALCVDRSPAIVVGLLAILKAGGAYVPLDPAYPTERLAYILSDAQPACCWSTKSAARPWATLPWLRCRCSIPTCWLKPVRRIIQRGPISPPATWRTSFTPPAPRATLKA